MRVLKQKGDFQVLAITGTHTVLMALNCTEEKRHGLLGFSFKRELLDKDGKVKEGKWIRSQKVFKSIVPDPSKVLQSKTASRFSTWEHPVQSFIWGDYGAAPDTHYRFSVVPRYGKPSSMTSAPGVVLEVQTEKEFDQGQGVWFNRGAIASQAFVREFDNKEPADPDNPEDKETKWLSRGLLEACLKYINDTPKGEALRVAAYEFTYAPVLNALKAALDRGVDVQIVYHDTTNKGKDGENEKAIAKAKLPAKKGENKVLWIFNAYEIPHNKFIVRLKKGKPSAVWTGSTNFTPSGFLGQTNVGHLVEDAGLAQKFLDYWEILKQNLTRAKTRAVVIKLSPNPPDTLEKDSIMPVFSPRPTPGRAKKGEEKPGVFMLDWYGKRMCEAKEAIQFTAAFGVCHDLVDPLCTNCDQLRFLMMEKPLPDKPQGGKSAEDDQAYQDGLKMKKSKNLVISYGAVLGELYKNMKSKKHIEGFKLDQWLCKEDHYRDNGNIFFLHTKILLVDPNSADPQVYTGSANFSKNSVENNNENMLLIRGNTRVADIYMTEFDRIFRHFYFRDIANELESRGKAATGVFLDETDKWTDSYFRPNSFKTLRREMFFKK
jgi:hypothetical protein